MKRCPFKTNLNKSLTTAFRDSDFHFFFVPEENDDGTYSALKNGISQMYLWAVYDTFNGNTQYTAQEKDKVIELVFDGVLQETLSDDLYTEYCIIKKKQIHLKRSSSDN